MYQFKNVHKSEKTIIVQKPENAKIRKLTLLIDSEK